jgi:hypothetical protein
MSSAHDDCCALVVRSQGSALIERSLSVLATLLLQASANPFKATVVAADSPLTKKAIHNIDSRVPYF